MNLELYGWNESRNAEISASGLENCIPGRVGFGARGLYSVVTETGEIKAELSGSFRYKALSGTDFPVVGDFVLLKEERELFLIEKVLSRKSILKRKSAGVTSQEQILAANLDIVFLVFGLDGGRSFNTGSLERLLTLVWDGGASPVVVLNKVDLCEDATSILTEINGAAPGVPVIMASAVTGTGAERIKKVLGSGRTGLFIGRSGVGKSALTNMLAGELIRDTGSVRDDDRKGRHTTTSRNMFQLSWGGILIDSPGIREIQLTGDTAAVSTVFSDIETAAESCRFSNCTHNEEPGCAVREAIDNGLLAESRLRSYRKYMNEVRYQERRGNHRLEILEKQKWKAIHKEYKNFGRKKR